MQSPYLLGGVCKDPTHCVSHAYKVQACAPPEGQVTKVEDEAGDDHPALPSAPQCTHTKHWKRLRAKRGIAVFVCCHCGTKWRVCSIGARNQSSGTSLRTTC